MVRKQIYIHRILADRLSRLAAARGVSEAEVVRQAIEHEVAGSRSVPVAGSRQAWQAALDFALSRRADANGAPYRWRRSDAYEDRDAQLGD